MKLGDGQARQFGLVREGGSSFGCIATTDGGIANSRDVSLSACVPIRRCVCIYTLTCAINAIDSC